MPIGVIVDVLTVVFGGIIGALAGSRLSDHFKDNMNLIFGCCAMGMGISAIVLMQNMPAVIFSIIVGTALGLAVHLGDLVNRAAAGMQKLVSKILPYKGDLAPEEFNNLLVTVIVIFCASGTGVYGTLMSGMVGDETILLSKAVMDKNELYRFSISSAFLQNFSISTFSHSGLNNWV